MFAAQFQDRILPFDDDAARAIVQSPAPLAVAMRRSAERTTINWYQ
jgi:hypothetical protein